MVPGSRSPRPGRPAPSASARRVGRWRRGGADAGLGAGLAHGANGSVLRERALSGSPEGGVDSNPCRLPGLRRPRRVRRGPARLVCSPPGRSCRIAQASGLVALLVIVTVLARRLSVAQLGAYGLVASLAGYLLVLRNSVASSAVRAMAARWIATSAPGVLGRGCALRGGRPGHGPVDRRRVAGDRRRSSRGTWRGTPGPVGPGSDWSRRWASPPRSTSTPSAPAGFSSVGRPRRSSRWRSISH